MVTLDSFLIDKYLQGMIAREEVINKSQDPTTIMAKLQELDLAQAVGSQGQKIISFHVRRNLQSVAVPHPRTGAD